MTAASPVAPRGAAQTGTALRGWAPSLIAVALACAAFGAVFSHEIAGAVRVWMGSTAYNHCFLVLPLAAFLLWDRRAVISALRPRSTLWPLVLLPVLSAVWTASALLDVLEGEQLVAVALFEVLLLSLLGPRVFRALLGPLLFLFFLVPFGGFLVPWLQQVTTHIAVAGLQLFNIPVFADGVIIEIPEGAFEVAEACAGLRFLIASLVFGCFFATIVYRSPLRRVAFIALSVIVPILANGMRAFGLIAVAHIAGSATAVEADHILYGWLFFTLVTLLLIALGISFRDQSRPPAAQSPVRVVSSPVRTGATAAAGLLLAFAGPIYLGLLGSPASAAPPDLQGSLAPTKGGWTLQPETATDWTPSGVGADRQVLRVYQDGAANVTEFVGVYRLRPRNGQLTTTANRLADDKTWRLLAGGREQTVVNGATLTVNTAQIAGEGRRRLVWWFYMINDQTEAGLLAAKLLQARAVLDRSARFGAFVAISTEIDSSADDAGPRLARFLQAMLPMRHP